MQPEIHPFDPKRLFIGENPVGFLGEIVVRAIITYVILLVAARLLGKRVAGQMSVLELTIIVTLGAAIGVPLEAPERGILPAVIVLSVAIAYQRALGTTTRRSRRAVALLEGEPSLIVADGMLVLQAVRALALSRERIFAMLRQVGVIQLGEVKRAYLEASGQLSLFKYEEPAPGLCLLPGDDQVRFAQRFAEGARCACRSCGHVVERGGGACERCGKDAWTPAVKQIVVDAL